jgi:hypothetical protein
LILESTEHLACTFMARVPSWEAGSPLAGCAKPDGNACATATQMEALIAAWDVLAPRKPRLGLELRQHIELGLAYLLKCQVRSGSAVGGIVRSPLRLPVGGDESARKFNQAASEIRIDYVQHAASAFLTWYRFLGELERSAA